MTFERNENKDAFALPGAGDMGTAVMRRFAAGCKLLLDEHASFVNDSDFLIDGDGIAAICTETYKLGK